MPCLPINSPRARDRMSELSFGVYPPGCFNTDKGGINASASPSTPGGSVSRHLGRRSAISLPQLSCIRDCIRFFLYKMWISAAICGRKIATISKERIPACSPFHCADTTCHPGAAARSAAAVLEKGLGVGGRDRRSVNLLPRRVGRGCASQAFPSRFPFCTTFAHGDSPAICHSPALAHRAPGVETI